MSEYKITLIGLETFINKEGSSLFNSLLLPAGIDKELLKDNILMRSGEFEVLYADPYLTQSLISIWSRKYYSTFERWVKALNIEYDPLNNYDRHEIIEDATSDFQKGNTKNESGSDTTSTTESKVETDDITDYDESAFNETAPTAKSKTTLDGEINSFTQDLGQTTSDSNTDTSLEKDGTYKRQAHLYGNIGVTTSQQMLQSELDLGYWNLIDRITDLFLREFCLLVY